MATAPQAKRARPGRPRLSRTPKRLGPIRLDPAIYDRLTTHLDAHPDKTQRQVLEQALTAYLDTAGA